MCEYCRSATVKERKEFYDFVPKYLLNKSYNITGLGVELQNNVFIEKTFGGDEVRLFLVLSTDNDTLIDKSIKINYCPICGQKLEA